MNEFLDDLCAFTEEATKNLRLPVKPTKDNREPADKAPAVYKMRLPNAKSYQEKAPYIIHQIVTFKDYQHTGQRTYANCVVRTVFCVYCEDEMDGALHLLNVIEDVRQAWLRKRVISDLYQLEMDEDPPEGMIYDQQPVPFFISEMLSVWKIPTIEREVPLWQR